VTALFGALQKFNSLEGITFLAIHRLMMFRFFEALSRRSSPALVLNRLTLTDAFKGRPRPIASAKACAERRLRAAPVWVEESL
jgi:hypothetical protein